MKVGNAVLVRPSAWGALRLGLAMRRRSTL